MAEPTNPNDFSFLPTPRRTHAVDGKRPGQDGDYAPKSVISQDLAKRFLLGEPVVLSNPALVGLHQALPGRAGMIIAAGRAGAALGRNVPGAEYMSITQLVNHPLFDLRAGSVAASASLRPLLGGGAQGPWSQRMPANPGWTPGRVSKAEIAQVRTAVKQQVNEQGGVSSAHRQLLEAELEQRAPSSPLAEAAVMERRDDRAPAQPGDAPTPLPHQVGTLDYYKKRHQDFVRRHPDLTPPDYYLGYGDKYIYRFRMLLHPILSPAGKKWLTAALELLQQAIENQLPKTITTKHGRVMTFDELEQDNEAFKAFTYGTHADAYLKAGLHNLPPSDLLFILRTPDEKDLKTREGIEQIVETIGGIVPEWVRDLHKLTEQKGSF